MRRIVGSGALDAVEDIRRNISPYRPVRVDEGEWNGCGFWLKFACSVRRSRAAAMMMLNFPAKIDSEKHSFCTMDGEWAKYRPLMSTLNLWNPENKYLNLQ